MSSESISMAGAKGLECRQSLDNRKIETRTAAREESRDGRGLRSLDEEHTRSRRIRLLRWGTSEGRDGPLFRLPRLREELAAGVRRRGAASWRDDPAH